MRTIAGSLPAGLPASIFVVLHTREDGTLPELLNSVSKLPALYAVHNAPILPGRIYLAPGGRHLRLDRGRVRLSVGPRENRHRPSIDVLFRSAAQAYGERVVGVVLTGYLDDGTAGLEEIKTRGGLSIVQDPDTAVAPSMPRNALENVEVDYLRPTEEIAGLLVQLANGGPAAAPTGPTVGLSMGGPTQVGNFSPTCPDCAGPTYEIQQGNVVRYECIVGHSFSPETLLEARADETERALWAAIRSFEEHAALSKKLAQRSADRNQDEIAARFFERSSVSHQNAKALRRLLDQACEIRETPEDAATGTEG